MRFNHLVKEWAWRVNNGMPDPKKRTHLQILEDVLRDYKYSEDFIQEYILQIEAVCQQGQNPGRDGCVAADGAKGSGKKAEDEPKKEKSKEEKAATIKQIMSHDGPLPMELRVQKKEILDELRQDAAQDSKNGKEIREALDSIKTLDGTDRENRELLIALGQTYTERDNAGWDKNSFGMADRDQLNKNEKQLMELYGDGSPEHVEKGVRNIRKNKVSEQEVKEMFDTLPPKLQKYLKSAGKGGKNVGDNHFVGYRKKDGTITSDRNDPDLEIGPDGKPVAERRNLPSKARAMLILRIYKEQGGMCAYTGLPLDLESMDLEHVVGLNNKDKGDPKDHVLDRENDNNFVITTSAANQKKSDDSMGTFYERHVHPLKDKTKEDFEKMDAARETAGVIQTKTEITAMRMMNNPVLKTKKGDSITLEEYEALPEDERPEIKPISGGGIEPAEMNPNVTDESLMREFDSEEQQFKETRDILNEQSDDKSYKAKVYSLQSKLGKKVIQSMGLTGNLASEEGRRTNKQNEGVYKAFALEIAAASPEDRKKLKQIWQDGIKFANSRDGKGNLVNGKFNGKNQPQEFRKFIIREMKKRGIKPKHTVSEKYKGAWKTD